MEPVSSVQCIYFCTPVNFPRPHKPAICQCKCASSKELRSRWSLNSTDPTIPGSDLVDVCSDPWFKQAKFLESHQRLDLQMAITDLARREMADTEQQQQELTTEKESDSTLKALDLLLGSSSDSSDLVQDEVENYFKQEQSPRDSSPLDWWKINELC